MQLCWIDASVSPDSWREDLNRRVAASSLSRFWYVATNGSLKMACLCYIRELSNLSTVEIYCPLSVENLTVFFQPFSTALSSYHSINHSAVSLLPSLHFTQNAYQPLPLLALSSHPSHFRPASQPSARRRPMRAHSLGPLTIPPDTRRTAPTVLPDGQPPASFGSAELPSQRPIYRSPRTGIKTAVTTRSAK